MCLARVLVCNCAILALVLKIKILQILEIWNERNRKYCEPHANQADSVENETELMFQVKDWWRIFKLHFPQMRLTC